MGDLIAVDPPKACMVQTPDGAWHHGTLTHWWLNPRGVWEGCVVSPMGLGQTVGVWITQDRLRPAPEE